MGRACSTCGKVRHCAKFCYENLKGRDVLTDMRVLLEVNTDIILKDELWDGVDWIHVARADSSE